ncbi:hypothetical protein RJ640_023805 [Escallonia rubra]|uniref:Bromo domain-containing protein n=1 Tax=Escallonia rubra TaxID=112253 RepID=A0AA88QHN9_9ASTE|nr:hypothetical protein RJ640_023805 [Escallonia rubra]
MARGEKRAMANNWNQARANGQPLCTWQQFVLVCAVQRFGKRNWHTLAHELRKTSPPSDCRLQYQELNPRSCRLQYQELTRQFAARHGPSGDEDSTIEAMIDELTQLRIAEVIRAGMRGEAKIESLKETITRLKKEADQDEKAAEEVNGEPEGVVNEEPEEELNLEFATISISNGNGESTIQENEPVQIVSEPVQTESEPLQTVSKPVLDCLATLKLLDSVSQDEFLANPMGASTSYDEPKRRQEEGTSMGSVHHWAMDRWSVDISQTLVKYLEFIRAQDCGSVFEHRLPLQETEEYAKRIRQHMDLQIIQKRLEEGNYLQSAHSFFRDLLLLCTNAIVFFPYTSREHTAAVHLRELVHILRPESTSASQNDVDGEMPHQVVVCGLFAYERGARKMDCREHSKSLSLTEVAEEVVQGQRNEARRSSRTSNKMKGAVIVSDDEDIEGEADKKESIKKMDRSEQSKAVSVTEVTEEVVQGQRNEAWRSSRTSNKMKAIVIVSDDDNVEDEADKEESTKKNSSSLGKVKEEDYSDEDYEMEEEEEEKKRSSRGRSKERRGDARRGRERRRDGSTSGRKRGRPRRRPESASISPEPRKNERDDGHHLEEAEASKRTRQRSRKYWDHYVHD